jgi:hypothetical protein
MTLEETPVFCPLTDSHRECLALVQQTLMLLRYEPLTLIERVESLKAARDLLDAVCMDLESSLPPTIMPDKVFGHVPEEWREGT